MSAPPTPFSVVTPLYNKAEFIERTVRSALAQRTGCAEVIVVDDGSSDPGPDLVRAIADPRVRLVEQPNAGPGPARNRGVAEARQAWIAFLDADDLWLPVHLEELAAVIRQFPDAEVVASGWKRASRKDAEALTEQPTEENAARRLDYFRERAASEAVWTSATAVRRDVFLSSGGFGPVWPGEDVELWARLALDRRFAITTRTTAIYVQETGGAMDSGASSAGYEASPSAQPLIALLDRAREDPRYAAIRDDLTRFRNETLVQWARPAIYNANPRLARCYLGAVSGPKPAGMLAYQMLAHLPTPLLRAGRAVRELLKGAG